jgi:adenylylsulfate kinase-like enzyme
MHRADRGPGGEQPDRVDAAATVVVLMGVAGSGKTTIGRLLAAER